jgi:thiamine pyrophosphokinase
MEATDYDSFGELYYEFKNKLSRYSNFHFTLKNIQEDISLHRILYTIIKECPKEACKQIKGFKYSYNNYINEINTMNSIHECNDASTHITSFIHNLIMFEYH